jgi:hypothetical protein
VTRRDFVRVVGATAAAATLAQIAPLAEAAESVKPAPETLVQKLYKSFTPAQQQKICFPWDHTDQRGLLRTRVENNWQITDVKELNVAGKFFTADQQEIIHEIFHGLYNKDWHQRIAKQLQDDAGGYGKQQTIALFGTPGSGKFEFVMTGRHLTIRCDGDSAANVAFGGPIFYGHAAKDFYEEPSHPGNVFWPQAQKANAVYKMLNGKQRAQALVELAPHEAAVSFRKKPAEIPGVPISELTSDQKAHAQEVLQSLLEPYRVSDQHEALKALKAQGGLDACRLSFFRKGTDGDSLDLGDDGQWDVWRLEGPAFVWHFRGAPHVHVWVNVADNPNVPLNAHG